MGKLLSFFISFRGRVNRTEFIFVLPAMLYLLFIISNVLNKVVGLVTGVTTIGLSLEQIDKYVPFVSKICLSILALVVIISLFSFVIRRLHDCNYSGHWVWIGLVVIFSGFLLLRLTGIPTASLYFSNVDERQWGINAIYLFCAQMLLQLPATLLWLIPGTKGPNRFGEASYCVTVNFDKTSA